MVLGDSEQLKCCLSLKLQGQKEQSLKSGDEKQIGALVLGQKDCNTQQEASTMKIISKTWGEKKPSTQYPKIIITVKQGCNDLCVCVLL